jgi:Uma2 family endonuclease
MANLATPEFLIGRWEQACRDPSLQDLPYKIEINAWGMVEMSPASNRHGRLQMALGAELMKQLPGGVAIAECSILTRLGIRVPDVTWASEDFMRTYGEITPYLKAPEICVEIVSPSNDSFEIEEKTGAYLAAGAKEVWIAAEDGTIRYFTAAGEQPKSGFAISITLPPPIK